MLKLFEFALRKTKTSTFLPIRHLSEHTNVRDTCGPLSPTEWHTNSNCLECLAHGRVCFQGFVQEQASSGRMATIIRIRCIFAELFGRIHYSAYCSDRI